MSAAEEDDVKLQRASATLLLEFEKLLPRLLRKSSINGDPTVLRQRVRDVEMGKASNLVLQLPLILADQLTRRRLSLSKKTLNSSTPT